MNIHHLARTSLLLAALGLSAQAAPLTFDFKDPKGVMFGEEMDAKATAEGAWFDYTWPDPATGRMAAKKSWFVLHDNLVFISGIYVR